jgi:GT2 family glycosyltransferase
LLESPDGVRETLDHGIASVTLAVPARNAAATIERCLAAVGELDPAPGRVLVVDDGSVDATPRLAAAAGAEVVSVPMRGGLGRARNLALSACGTDHLAFLNADCYPAPDWLGRLVEALEATAGSVAGGRQLEIRHSTAAERWKAVNLRQDCGDQALVDPDFLSGGNLLVAVTTLRGVWFDPRHRTAYEDVDFCRRLRAVGGHLVYEPRATVLHDHAETLWSLPRKVWSYGAPSPRVGPARTLPEAVRAFVRMHRRPGDQVAQALRRDLRRRSAGFVALDLYLLAASFWFFCLGALSPRRHRR